MILTQTRWMKVLLLILLSACTIRPPEQSHATSVPVLKHRYKEAVVADGTVIDNQTGLIWLKNSNCFGELTWKRAKQRASNLAHGQCELQDGSKPGMWQHFPTQQAPVIGKKVMRSHTYR